MAVDPKIKQKAEDIRKKIFGSEVRESLASGLEGMSEDVESIKGRQDTVESTFQSVIEETTGKDVISAPEIIAARGGHDNLSQRLLSTDQQLQDVAVVNVKHFGAKGDGRLGPDGTLLSGTDDSEAIKLAISHLPKNNGILYFPPGVYVHGDGILGENGTGNSYSEHPNFPKRPLRDATHLVDIGRDIRFLFEEYTNLEVRGYGATIKSHPNNGECRNNEIFRFINCKDLKVKGLTVDGSSHQRGVRLNDYNDGSGMSNRHNIVVTGGENINLIDVTSNYSMMDGINIAGNSGVPTVRVSIINCNTDYAYRNGLTISTCTNVRIEGGAFTNTGVTYGTAPMVGIDIEADWGGTMNENVVVDGITCEGNVIGGVVFAVGASNCVVRNSKFLKRQTVSFGFDPTRWGHNIVENCHFIDTVIPTSATAVTYKNNTFDFHPIVPEGDYYDSPIIPGLFDLQGVDKADDAYVIIDNNIFNINLDGVSELATRVTIGQLWYENRKNVEFTNNKVINMYNRNGRFFNVRTGKSTKTTGNTFAFTDNRLVSLVTKRVFQEKSNDGAGQPFENFSDNIITGYNENVKLSGSSSRLGALTTGQSYTYSQILSTSKVYMIDFDLITSGHDALKYAVDIQIHQMNSKIHITSTDSRVKRFDYLYGEPTINVNTLCKVYKSDKKIYIKTDTSNIALVLNVTVNDGHGNYLIDSSKTCVIEVPEDSILGMTEVSSTVNVRSVAQLADLSLFIKPLGYSVWVTSLSKVAIWGGTSWRDSMGVTL